MPPAESFQQVVLGAAARGPITWREAAEALVGVAGPGREERTARDAMARLRRREMLVPVAGGGYELGPAGWAAIGGPRPTAEVVLRRLVAMERAGVELSPHEREQVRLARATLGRENWRESLPALFPGVMTLDPAPFHEWFLDRVWGIRRGVRPEPIVIVWPRGGAKSSLMEIAAVMLGALGVRRYCWYVSASKDSAASHLNSIEALLLSSEVASVYPAMASRGVSAYGPKEWRVDRLATAGGFTVDAIGLDQAVRGRRYEEQRPDLMILDDLDQSGESLRMTEKRIRTLTGSVLPARAPECAVIAGQNLVHSQSIFARLCGYPGAPPADFLADRVVSGPVPLVDGLRWEARVDRPGYDIVGGEATWPALGLAGCQAAMDDVGLTAFLIECQHEEGSLGGGVGEHLDFGGMTVRAVDTPVLVALVATVDPAVTATDRSDSCAVVLDGLGVDGRLYRWWAWEKIAQPVEVLSAAVNAVCEAQLEADVRLSRSADVVVLVETDQGGDTWRTVYDTALRQLLADEGSAAAELVEFGSGRLPRFEQVKAGASNQSKGERVNSMVGWYELGRVRHVADSAGRSRVGVLEAGLRRFPVHKPYDCADAAAHGARWLLRRAGDGRRRATVRSPSGQMPTVSAHSATGYQH